MSNFLLHVGIDPNGGKEETLMEVMSIALHCLGAVRVLSTQIEQERQVAWATSLDMQIELERKGFSQWAVRKTFSHAVKRMLNPIVRAQCPHNLDPSRHIIESFPSAISPNWMAAHWAVLGDPDEHHYCPDLDGVPDNSAPIATGQASTSSEDPTTDILEQANSIILSSIARENGCEDNDDDGEDEECMPDWNAHSCTTDDCSSASARGSAATTSSSASSGPHVEDDRLWILRSLVSRFPNTIQERDLEGRTVLHVAARLDSVPLFQCTLRQCKDFNGPTLATANANGALPLHNTARFSRSEEVFRAVAKAYPGALTITNNEGLYPLHWAAAKNRSLGIIRCLLQYQPESINVVNNESCLPLHCAGQNDSLEVVQAIYAADPRAISIPDHEGGLPLHHACCLAENVEVVRFLYEAYKEAITVAEEEDQFPIHLAASHNTCPDILRYILSVCPEAARLRDRGAWCAAHCMLLSTGTNIRWLDRRLECLRLVLKANPDLDDIYLPSHCDAVARLVLRRLKEKDMERYRALNWRARRTLVFLLVQLARSPVTDSAEAKKASWRYSWRYRYLQAMVSSDCHVSAREVHRQVQFDVSRVNVLRRLVERFMSPDSGEIPSGLLRKIVSFL